MIFSEISDELFDYRIYIIKHNIISNISRVFREHNEFIRILSNPPYNYENIFKLAKYLKKYRDIVKSINFKLYKKLVPKHLKIFQDLTKIYSKLCRNKLINITNVLKKINKLKLL